EVLDRARLRQHVELRVADELRLESGARRELRGALQVALVTARTGDDAVLLHQRAEAVDVDRLAALLRKLLRQLDRKAERRGEREGILGVDRGTTGEIIEHALPA